MKKSTRNIAINFLLLVLIAMIVWIGYVWLIGGPTRLYEEQDTLYIKKFIEQEKYDEAQLLSRFSFDSVYYVVEAKKDDVTQIVWFSDTFDKKGTHELVTYDAVYELADTYGVDHSSVSFGVYEGKLVYVLKKDNLFEMFVSVDTLDIVFHIGGMA